MKKIVVVLLAVIMLVGTAWAGETVPTKVLKRSHRRPANDATYGIYVRNRDDYRYHWDAFGYKRDRPPVNFKKRVVVFVAHHESSSCPLHFESSRVNRKERRITVRLEDGVEPHEACTDDWVPLSFVLSLRRASLPTGELKIRIRRV